MIGVSVAGELRRRARIIWKRASCNADGLSVLERGSVISRI